MKLGIGETIKNMRREKDITQEELADMLGVSCQSVSRWETGACYPDMELLPVLSEFFGVTVDKLLGIDERIEQKNVDQYLNRFQEAINQGKIYDCIAIAREGVAEYPNNFVLLNKLMYALFVSGDESGNISEWKENMEKNDGEITALGERIIKYCPDQDIRLEATARLAFNHCEMGRKKIGRAIYESLPSSEFCKENQMWWSLSEEEKLPFLRKKIKQDYEIFSSFVWQLADSGCISDEQSILVMKKVLEFEKIVFDNDAPPIKWATARIPFDIARLYVRIGDNQKAVQQLKIAAAGAKAFDDRPEKQLISSILFGDFVVKRIDFETADTRSLSEIMRDTWLSFSDFDKLRGTDEFKEILNMLD